MPPRGVWSCPERQKRLQRVGTFGEALGAPETSKTGSWSSPSGNENRNSKKILWRHSVATLSPRASPETARLKGGLSPFGRKSGDKTCDKF